MEVFEYAVILSINQMDRDSFNRYMSCLKPYYLNYARWGIVHDCLDIENCIIQSITCVLSHRGQKSEITNAILGLNLLYLLVENRLADFHCEVIVHLFSLMLLISSHLPLPAVCSLLLYLVGASFRRGEAAAHSHVLHTARPAPGGGIVRPGLGLRGQPSHEILLVLPDLAVGDRAHQHRRVRCGCLHESHSGRCHQNSHVRQPGGMNALFPLLLIARVCRGPYHCNYILFSVSFTGDG